MDTSSWRDDTVTPPRRGRTLRPRRLLAGALTGMMGLFMAIPSSHADTVGETSGASGTINIHHHTEPTQQSGTDFQYQIEVAASGVDGDGEITDTTVFIPFDGGINPEWALSAESSDVENPIDGTEEESGYRITFTGPIDAGTSTNFILTVRPPNGTTPNGTSWDIEPQLQYRSDGAPKSATVDQAVTSVATAEPLGDLSKQFGHDRDGDFANSIAVLPGDTVWMRLGIGLGLGNTGSLHPEHTVITDVLREGLELDNRQLWDDEDVKYDDSSRTITVTLDQDRLVNATIARPVVPLRVTADVPSGEEVTIRNDATAETKYIGQDELVESESNARVNVAEFVPDGSLFSKEFTSNTPDGFGPGVLDPEILLTDAQSDDVAYYDLRMRHSAVGDYDAAMFDALPCYDRENNAGGYSSPSMNGHDSSPCQDGVMNLKTMRLHTPGTYSLNEMDVVLHLADGTTKDFTLEMSSNQRISQTIEIDESWDVSAVEVKKFTVPSNTSGERVFLRLGVEVPDDERLEHADIIRNSGYGAVANVGQPLGEYEPYIVDAQIWKPKATVSPAIRGNSDVIDSEGNSLENPARWGLWHNTKFNVDPSDPLADKARWVYLLPPVEAGITVNPSQMERNWSEPYGEDFTYHEDFEGTGRPAFEVRGSHVSNPIPTRGALQISDAEPGAYPIDLYVGYDGQSANDAECVRNTIRPDSAYSKDAVVVTPDFWPVADTGVCHVSNVLTLTTLTDGFQLDKQIREDDGDLWESYTGEPLVAESGTAQFNIGLTNTGPNELHDAVFYDMLPTPGDTGTVDGQTGTARGSTTRGVLTEPVEAPEGFTVSYSTSDNPQRERVNPNLEDTVDDWTTEVPDDLSTVTALRFDGGDTVIASGETVNAVVKVALEDDEGVAWNTVSGDADVVGQPGSLLPVEPPKVGFATVPIEVLPEEPEPSITLDKNEPGDDSHEVESGEHEVTVVFTNNGEEALTDFIFTDTTESGNAVTWNQEQLDGLEGLELAPGENYTITGTVQVDKGVTHRDTASVGATGVISGEPVKSDDPTTLIPEDPEPGIVVEKNEPGDDRHEVESGVHDVIVTIDNNGEEALTDFTFTDVTQSGEDVVWDQQMLAGLAELTLAPGESYHVRGRVDVIMGTTHRDTAVVDAKGVISGNPVQDDDPTTLVPEDPETDIVVEKNVAGDDVHHIDSGTHPVTVNFVNLGTEDLTDFVFTDVTESGNDVVWNEGELAGLAELTLAPGESYQVTGEVEVNMGTTHKDTVTVEATGVISGEPVESDDPTTFIPEDPAPDIKVEKNEAGDDVHNIESGTHPVTVDFTNDGNENLTDFVFTDLTESGEDVVWNEDELAALDELTLAPGESFQITGEVEVIMGTMHRDVATVQANGVISGDSVESDDPTTLVPEDPETSLIVEKNEAGDDVTEVDPGDHDVTVNFTNGGTEPLSGFVFTDVTESGEDVVWNEDELAGLKDLVLEPGQSYQVTGTVEVIEGEEHRDTVIIEAIGTISGDPFVADDPTTLVPNDPAAPPLPGDPEQPLAKTGAGTVLTLGGIAAVLLLAGIAIFAYSRKNKGDGLEV